MMAMLMGLTVLSLVRTILDSIGGETERDGEILNFDPNFDFGKDRRHSTSNIFRYLSNKDDSWRESEVRRCQTLRRR